MSELRLEIEWLCDAAAASSSIIIAFWTCFDHLTKWRHLCWIGGCDSIWCRFGYVIDRSIANIRHVKLRYFFVNLALKVRYYSYTSYASIFNYWQLRQSKEWCDFGDREEIRFLKIKMFLVSCILLIEYKKINIDLIF